jgi:O-antigen/teichoic acid export membrane protein
VFFSAPDLSGWLLLAPLVLLMTGLFNLGGYFANRNKQYRIMSNSKLLQALVVVGVNITLGLMDVGFIGLLLGNIFGLVTAFIYLFYRQRSYLAGVTMRWDARKVLAARRYSDYPAYNASAGLLDGITLSLPVFFITHSFAAEAVGYFALVMRVMYAPLSFVSVAVSQVNLKKVVDMVNEGIRVEPYIYKTGLGLLILSLLPATVLILWGPELFSIVFGEKWLLAGRYSQILAISMIVRFVASTLSSTMGATKNNKYSALWKVTAFISTFIVLTVATYYGSIEQVLIALVVNDVILYALYYYLIILAAMNPRK